MNISAILKNKLKAWPYTVRFLLYSYWFTKLYGETVVRLLLGKFRKPKAQRFTMPTVLQLPITFKCNCDCVMCGMRSMQKSKDFTPEQLKSILDNTMFRQIRSVGVNGGEPFLATNLPQYIDVLIEMLPRLSSIYVISNGAFTNRMLTFLEEIKRKCVACGIKLGVSISIDGVGKTHDDVRGITGIFDHATESYFAIKKDMARYCDYLGAICTINRHNIYEINALDVWAKKNEVSINYNIATVHERLFNQSRYNDFSVFSDPQKRCLAVEFFYSKFLETKSKYYYSLYYYIKNNRRITTCEFQSDGLTITPDGNLAYCATKSKIIGNCMNGDPMAIYKQHLPYRKELTDTECGTCSHYTGALSLRGTLEYNKDILRIFGGPLKF